MENLKLSKWVSQKMLLDCGFRTINGKIYSLMKYLYTDIIYLRIWIKPGTEEMEWEVIDKNTGSLYHPFYHNINGENNLVAIAVRDKFRTVVEEMKRKGVLEENKEDEH